MYLILGPSSSSDGGERENETLMKQYDREKQRRKDVEEVNITSKIKSCNSCFVSGTSEQWTLQTESFV